MLFIDVEPSQTLLTPETPKSEKLNTLGVTVTPPTVTIVVKRLVKPDAVTF